MELKVKMHVLKTLYEIHFQRGWNFIEFIDSQKSWRDIRCTLVYTQPRLEYACSITGRNVSLK